MSNDTRLPSWRRGWTWTLIKCSGLTGITTLAGMALVYWLLHAYQPPWFIPPPVFEWIVRHLLPYALWLGGIAGALAGLAGSVGVVLYDAKKGRLTRLR